ncbi:hypothetical protein KC316_g1644 [Hortaea werneckii]|nr:hypothetical protein KC355_g971 [Hortaea werneckii]KAI7202820.1 hypothetical protein KC324_g1553 [Hortaea werneckii]KAI7593589.1 hypothetical protein KC316_g1644 [Hortaea werneckii]
MPSAGRNPRGRHGAPSINNQLQLVPSGGPRAYARRNACSLRHIEYVTDHAKYEFAKALATSQSDDIEFLRQVERETESKALVDEIYEFEQTILSKRDNPEATLACLAMEEMYSLVLRVKETSRERFNHMIGDIRGQVERTCKENDRLRIARARWNWLRIGQKVLRKVRARRNWQTTIDSLTRHSLADTAAAKTAGDCARRRWQVVIQAVRLRIKTQKCTLQAREILCLKSTCARERWKQAISLVRLRVRRQIQASQVTQGATQRAKLSRTLSIERWQRAIRTVQLLLRARQISHYATHVAILKHQSTSLKRQVYALRSCVRHEDCRFAVLRDQLTHRKQQLRNQKKSRAQEARERDDLQQQVHSTERRLAQVEHFSTAVAKHAFPELRRQDRLIRDGQRMLSSMLNHFDDARARSARERRSFSRRLEDLQEALRRKTTDFNKASETVQQLAAKLEDREHRNQELTLSVTTLTSDLEQKATDYIAASGEVQRLECEITELRDNLADLRLLYEYITDHKEELDQSVSTSAKRIEELTAHNTRLESAVATLTSEKQEVINQNANLDQRTKALTGHITYAKDRVQGLTENVEDLKQSNEELTHDNTRLKSAVATLTSEKQEITSQNAHLDRCNESAKHKVGELTECVKDLKRFNRELTRFNSTLNSEKLETDDRNAELDRCNKELANRITGAERQVAELSENIKMLDKSNESLTHSSNEMYMSNNTLESDKREAWHQNAEVNKSLRTMTERCAHAESEIRNITRARDDLADGTAKLEQQLNDSEGLVERLRDRTGTLEARVSELEDRNDKDRADQRRGLMEKQRYVEGRVSWFEGRIRDCEQEVTVKDNRSRELAQHYLQQFADQKSWYIDELQRVKTMKDAAAAYSKSPKLALKHLAMQFSADLRDADLTAQQDQQVTGELAGLVEVLCRAFTAAADKVEAAMSQKTMRKKRPFGARVGKKAKSTTGSGR